MNTCVDMIDKLRDTMQSHNRCSVVEVMGRRAGYMAVNVALAVGAEACLTLEREYDLEAIAAKMTATAQSKDGKHHFIIVVAEGVGQTEAIARQIQEMTGIEARATILGHVQRGGSPTLRDRVLATEMGYHAVELLEKGIGNRVVGVRGNSLVDYDIQEALKMTKPFDDDLYELSNIISI
jgi:6-phosphofructokinase 1